MWAEWKYRMREENRKPALTLSSKLETQYHSISYFLSFCSSFLWFVIFLLQIIFPSRSIERKERDCDWTLISFQMHWRRYQKIILSNLDYIWKWRMNFKDVFPTALFFFAEVGSFDNREPFMSNENFHLKWNCLLLCTSQGHVHINKIQTWPFSKTLWLFNIEKITVHLCLLNCHIC